MSPKLLDEVLATYREHGHRHYGEDVTEFQHALLHDYGHLSHKFGKDTAGHEHIRYSRLKGLFADEVIDAARLHVAAKRHLCWKEPDYYDGLSEASRKSLHLQGGPMNDHEACEFEREPHFDITVRVRRDDEMGKVPDMATPGLDAFTALLQIFICHTV
jgi:predicted HD phosphohydrolase